MIAGRKEALQKAKILNFSSTEPQASRYEVYGEIGADLIGLLQGFLLRRCLISEWRGAVVPTLG
jgi:hypothetical protein